MEFGIWRDVGMLRKCTCFLQPRAAAEGHHHGLVAQNIRDDKTALRRAWRCHRGTRMMESAHFAAAHRAALPSSPFWAACCALVTMHQRKTDWGSTADFHVAAALADRRRQPARDTRHFPVERHRATLPAVAPLMFILRYQ